MNAAADRDPPAIPLDAADAAEEDGAWFDALHSRLVAEQEPDGAVEAHLVWRLAMAIWRTDRAARLERQILAGSWSAARLQAMMRYQSQQRRELQDSLRLLEASRSQRARANLARPAARRIGKAAAATRRLEPRPLTPGDLAQVASWLEAGALRQRASELRLADAGDVLPTRKAKPVPEVAANLNQPQSTLSRTSNTAAKRQVGTRALKDRETEQRGRLPA